jgi:hypothetical protein
MSWISQYGDFITLIFTAAVAISTVVYAVLTWKLVSETRRMRRAQTDPNVAVFFEPFEDYMGFGCLCVQNIGLGPAYDLQFTLVPDGDLKGAESLIQDFCKIKHLERGIKYLGPGQKVRSGFTSLREGHDQKIKAVLNVSATYRSADMRQHNEEFRIDFSELEGTERLGTPHLHSIAETLKKLQGDLHSVVTGFKKLRVDVFDAEDRSKEREAQEEQIRKYREQKAARDAGA